MLIYQCLIQPATEKLPASADKKNYKDTQTHIMGRETEKQTEIVLETETETERALQHLHRSVLFLLFIQYSC